jgi:hypothetical protein
MKKMTLLMFLCIIATNIYAQDETVKDLKKASEKGIAKDPKDTIPKTWKVGGQYALNVSQGSLSNWAAGGDEFSLSLNSILNLFAFYQKGQAQLG